MDYDGEMAEVRGKVGPGRNRNSPESKNHLTQMLTDEEAMTQIQENPICANL